MTDTHVASTSLSAEELQSHFTSYNSIQLLAMGGMGAVYKARQLSLDRPVAIKVLTHACSTSPQFRQIFQCEAKVMAKLNHPNLASIYDYGEVNGMLYIVMQFVEGRSLHDAANGRSVQQHEAAALISKISKALGHAHDSGILHRDIKPANILIDSEINPVVVDFGLAHHAHESTMKGETVFGTPGYTAPEVLAPPYRADQRADIFSLGVLLHELLTGQLPQTPYLPPSRLAQIDPRYDSVVMRAIHPTPALRYSSTAALCEDLDNILTGKALAVSPLLQTAATHPQLAAASSRMIVKSEHPSATILSAKPLPINKSKASSALPSLSNTSSSNTKAMITALAACLTLALAIIALVISSESQDSTPPVATGGLPTSSSASSAGR